jgi:hypothetical protein
MGAIFKTIIFVGEKVKNINPVDVMTQDSVSSFASLIKDIVKEVLLP